MLVTIWTGLRFRGQTWEHFGLSIRFESWRALARTVLQSGIVFVLALAAFIAGSIVMQNVAAAPQSADMSGYSFLHGNLLMLLLALAAVYVVSSFGEKVLYRGFLMPGMAVSGCDGRLDRAQHGYYGARALSALPKPLKINIDNAVKPLHKNSRAMVSVAISRMASIATVQ